MRDELMDWLSEPLRRHEGRFRVFRSHNRKDGVAIQPIWSKTLFGLVKSEMCVRYIMEKLSRQL